jgi:hypothetical protein
MKLTARALALLAVIALAAQSAAAQALSPSDTVLAFYKLLREQRYAEGFAVSVYAAAIQGLSEPDLAELAPEFERTFANIPAAITIEGENVSGEVATVWAKFGERVEEIALVKSGGRWLVGDRETLEQVARDRAAFFFNARIDVNQTETLKLVREIMGKQDAAKVKAKTYAGLDELIDAYELTDDLRGGQASGYKFTLALTPDRSSYTVVAVPARYGRTGMLSFYGDPLGVRAADGRGGPVGVDAPLVPVGAEPPAAGRE